MENFLKDRNIHIFGRISSKSLLDSILYSAILVISSEGIWSAEIDPKGKTKTVRKLLDNFPNPNILEST